MIRGINSAIFAVSTSAVILTLNVTAIHAQPGYLGSHRLKTAFTGVYKCLDIINDGRNNKLTMADCGNYSGQNWISELTVDGYVRLRTEFTGEYKCLDIINDGQNNKLTMADCGNYTGQLWILEEEGVYVRFKTLFTGTYKCLDIINDGQNNKLTMADCGNYTGQLWIVEPF